jgi:hypothetical protein
MWLVLRTAILLPLALAIAVLVLLAIGVRIACLELLRRRPCLAL